MTNAQKIQAWRDANPTTRLNEKLLLEILGLKTLWGANLRGVDLWGANLRGADLRGTNLWGTNLWDADLWGGLPISTPSGSGYLVPTPDGWRITIGCWGSKNSLESMRVAVDVAAVG